MAQSARETTPSVASALLHPDTKGGQASAGACGRVGRWFVLLRITNVAVITSATAAIAICVVLRAEKTLSNRTTHWQETYEAATAGARKCWSSAVAMAQLVENDVMSPNIFSLDSATNGERGACSVLRARDATDDDCSKLVTVGGGGYFRLLYSGLYYVTVQVMIEAEAESGCIELIVARRRPRSGNAADDKGTKKLHRDRQLSCHDNSEGDASTAITLSAAKATLPGGLEATAPGAKANTTMYTSKLAALRSGDEISLRLRCFGVGTGGTVDGENGGCRLSVGRGSLLGLLPVELSSN